MWLAGFTAILRAMGDWAEGWLAEEVMRGIKGRSPDHIHAWIMGEIDRPKAEGEDLAGGKIDLKKCFDTICPGQAIALWEEWGSPEGVTEVLREFNEEHERWVEVKGVVARDPIKPKRSLLQGCPASPLLLAGIMTVWAEAVRKRVPDLKFAIYLDDRTIRDTGQESHMTIRRGLSCGRNVDRAFEMVEHPDKRELFGNKAKVVQAMKDMVKDRGTVGTGFKLLGIHYECTNRKRVHANDKKWKQARNRCKRIGLALRGDRYAHKRRHYIRSLVIPKILWGAGWEKAPNANMKKTRLSIERCVRELPMERHVGSRSRLLAWATYIGEDVCPFLQAALGAV